jgi:drug/metabolite transporter (DMT)-like permease
MWLILFLYMLLASTFTLGKAVLAYVQPVFFIGIRMLLAGSLLWGYHRLVQKKRFTIARQHYFLFAQIIFFHIYVAYICEFIALEYVNSWKAALLFNLAPFITAALSYLLLGERLGWQKWLGMVIGCLGFLPILLTAPTIEGATLFLVSWPEFLLFISVAASAYGWIVVKQLMVCGYDPIVINGSGMFFGGILALASSLIGETGPRFLLQPDGGYGWGMMIMYTLLLIIIANGIFYNLYGALLRRHSATLLSFAGFTTPLFTAGYGWLFLGERVQGSFFISMIVIVAGLALFYHDEVLRSA